VRLWAKARRTVLAGAAIAGSLAALVVIGGVTASLPGLLVPRGLAVPLALLAPLAVSIVVAYGLTAGDEALESVASRSVTLLDLGYVWVTASLACLTAAVAESVGLTQFGFAAGRNSIGYAGLLLIGLVVAGRNAAALTPVALTLFFAFFGGINRPSEVCQARPPIPARFRGVEDGSRGCR
jgi:hypothetical protein